MLRVTPALHKVLDELCKIARIPESNRHAFRAAAWSAMEVCSAAIWAAERKESFKQKKPYDRKSLRRIDKASAELSEALRERTEGADYYLLKTWVLDHNPSDYSVFLKSVALMSDAAKEAVESLKDGPAYGPPKTGRAGAPPYSRNYPAILLTRDLMAAAAEFGGRLTLDKNEPDSSLIRALKCCKRVLPQSFKIPSPSTLQRIKNPLRE